MYKKGNNKTYVQQGKLVGYKFELFPDYFQRILLSKHEGHARFIYNWALEQKQEYYSLTGKTLKKSELQTKLVELKKEKTFLKEVNSQSLQTQLINLENAYSRFFKKQGGFPNRKKKANGGSFQIPQFFEVCQIDGIISLPKIKGWIKYDNHRKIEGNIRSCVISKTSVGRWFVSFLVDKKIVPFEKTGKEIGIDLGLKSFIATSEGEKVDCPKFFRKKEKALARSQRVMARRKVGSKNREKQRIKVAKIHNDITNQRKDFLHKLSTKLVKENDVIYTETLKSSNMMKNRKLAKSIGDASWYSFVNMLGYKCDLYGKSLVKIGQFEKSTGVCSCGYKTKLELKVRTWICPACGQEHDRDVQSAKIIKQIGQGNGRIYDYGEITSTNSQELASSLVEIVTNQGLDYENNLAMIGETSSFRGR